jgi:hypothetical protein
MDGPLNARFEPVAVVTSVATSKGRGSGSRGRAVLAAWLLGLAAVVGVAGLGRLAEPAEAGPRPAVIAFEPPTVAVTPAPTAAPAPTPDLIVLASPAEAGVTVTSKELVVQGYLNQQFAAGPVRVTLEARGNRVIDDATITPALALGELPILDRHVQFEVRFGLPNPRPNGRMIVQVVAYDRDGRILDVLRRPIRVGALLEAPAADPA